MNELKRYILILVGVLVLTCSIAIYSRGDRPFQEDSCTNCTNCNCQARLLQLLDLTHDLHNQPKPSEQLQRLQEVIAKAVDEDVRVKIKAMQIEADERKAQQDNETKINAATIVAEGQVRAKQLQIAADERKAIREHEIRNAAIQAQAAKVAADAQVKEALVFAAREEIQRGIDHQAKLQKEQLAQKARLDAEQAAAKAKADDIKSIEEHKSNRFFRRQRDAAQRLNR